MFKLLKKSEKSSARRGELTLPHGVVQTPVFMPVGTQATVKGLTPAQVLDCNAQIILANTYHLNIRPTADLVEQMGGLHSFMQWPKPILTDSGGFQVFSLSSLRKITEKGIEFKSHIDGAKLFLSPESCVQIQRKLGSDISMVLDECIKWPCPKGECKQSVERTLRWAKRCLDEYRSYPNDGRLLFGITQGGTYEDIRTYCSKELAKMDFPGYAIGGVSVGEPEEEMLKQVAYCTPHLPENKPRYVMGVGTPRQLLEMIALGADMFDCVMPTRLARHGCAFTNFGTINLKNSKYRQDKRPIDETMAENYTTQFSRAYLRHLVVANEMLACTLLSIHNICYFQELMAKARKHIEQGDFEEWKAAEIYRMSQPQD